MTGVARAIFRAIHEGKWLNIQYKNKEGNTTYFWIAIRELDPKKGWVTVDGLHLHDLTLQKRYLYIEGILSAEVVEGTWYPRNHALLRDISENPEKYAPLFSNVTNLRILDYLSACNKLDSTPYRTNYHLLHHIDDAQLARGGCALNDDQFRELVQHFRQKTQEKPVPGAPLHLQQLGLNLLSLHTKDGLYVLAYRPVSFDVAQRALRAHKEIVLCTEFCMTPGGDPHTRQSIRGFLDADDLALLEHFEANQEQIKDRITRQNPDLNGVDDMPYLVAIGRDCLHDLDGQYKGILDLYHETDPDAVPAPLRAFFGDLTRRPPRRRAAPLILLDDKINLDQLLAMNHAMCNPLAYVQGPPGTGKTNTILNLLVTAFFNERTVLFASYNNHPIDSVVQRLQSLQYRGQPISFPIIRLGSNLMVAKAIETMRALYARCREVKVYENALNRNRRERAVRARDLARFLQRYEQLLDLRERRDTIERMLQNGHHLTFNANLTDQLNAIDRQIQQAGSFSTAEALELLDRNTQELYQYLYFTSAKCIRRLGDGKNKELTRILTSDAPIEELVRDFNHYLSNEDNLRAFLRIFPIVATTCSSAHKLGSPKPAFDMVVMDEASQCNTAVSLVPVLRGKRLVLVGDPQQLSPVVVLDPKHEQALRRRYAVSAEYNYLENSIYKCFLACDAVSDEVLLSHHYRCHKKIIEFNNRKYYNRRLNIDSRVESDRPLVYREIPHNTSDEKNTAPREALEIVRFLQQNPEKSVGIITPFARQRALIEACLQENGLERRASCGTVHAFQGDEKDVIIFSLALTDRTRPPTYNWLKNNKELINVAVSRARQQLVVLSSWQELERLHADAKDDDLYELVRYVRQNGESEVSSKLANSRALGIKPYSTKTETAFLENLNHALDNVLMDGSRCVIHKEVPISQVFADNPSFDHLFYTGRFDFVVYQKDGRQELPVLAIELDGKEHREDALVQARDQKKEAICRDHGFTLIRVENSYARRYHYIKGILERYFKTA